MNGFNETMFGNALSRKEEDISVKPEDAEFLKGKAATFSLKEEAKTDTPPEAALSGDPPNPLLEPQTGKQEELKPEPTDQEVRDMCEFFLETFDWGFCWGVGTYARAKNKNQYSPFYDEEKKEIDDSRKESLIKKMIPVVRKHWSAVALSPESILAFAVISLYGGSVRQAIVDRKANARIAQAEAKQQSEAQAYETALAVARAETEALRREREELMRREFEERARQEAEDLKRQQAEEQVRQEAILAEARANAKPIRFSEEEENPAPIFQDDSPNPLNQHPPPVTTPPPQQKLNRKTRRELERQISKNGKHN